MCFFQTRRRWKNVKKISSKWPQRTGSNFLVKWQFTFFSLFERNRRKFLLPLSVIRMEEKMDIFSFVTRKHKILLQLSNRTRRPHQPTTTTTAKTTTPTTTYLQNDPYSDEKLKTLMFVRMLSLSLSLLYTRTRTHARTYNSTQTYIENAYICHKSSFHCPFSFESAS